MAYSCSSFNTTEILSLLASININSSLVTLTYIGSLYLQKKTLMSLCRTSGLCWRIRMQFRRVRYCTSEGFARRVTSGGESFLHRPSTCFWSAM